MADYDFKYRLQSTPEPTLDGSGMIRHDIFAVAQEQGNGGWSVVPGRHKTFLVPSSELKTVMDMPDSDGAEKQAKNTSYKDALASNVDTQGVGIVGWSSADLENLMDANDAAALEASRADTYITVTLSLSYPVDFNS